MQLEGIRSPIRVRPAFPGESGDHKSRHVIPRNSVRRGVLERAGVRDRARRVRDVLEERQDLRHGDAKTHDDRCEHKAEPCESRCQQFVRWLAECEIEREQRRGDEEIVRRLHVRTEQAQRHGDCHQRIPPRPPIAQRGKEGETREGQHRGYEQLSVVTRPRVRNHDARQLIREPADHGTDPRNLESSQKQEREETSHDVVQNKAEVGDLVGREEPAQEGRRIQHVPVRHGRDVGQPIHDHRVPQRQVT